jgi:hypothetical protein
MDLCCWKMDHYQLAAGLIFPPLGILGSVILWLKISSVICCPLSAWSIQLGQTDAKAKATKNAVTGELSECHTFPSSVSYQD